MKAIVFDKNDNDYLRWMKNHSSSYIMNTERRSGTNYFWLHKSNCPHIASPKSLKKGAYTERQYIKVCADEIYIIEDWAKNNKPNFAGKFKDCSTCKPYSEKVFNNPIQLFPETISKEDEEHFEGAIKTIKVNAYERNLKARKKCLEIYGYDCKVCGLNFEKRYGLIGRYFIHVHHLIPISTIGEKYKLNPKTDLIPVCPNCHSMLHQNNPPFTLEELKTKLNKTKQD